MPAEESIKTRCTLDFPRFNLPSSLDLGIFSHPRSLEELESTCLIDGVKPKVRISRVVPEALEGSANLWFYFAGLFVSWNNFVIVFQSEFTPLDKKTRLKKKNCIS